MSREATRKEVERLLGLVFRVYVPRHGFSLTVRYGSGGSGCGSVGGDLGGGGGGGGGGVGGGGCGVVLPLREVLPRWTGLDGGGGCDGDGECDFEWVRVRRERVGRVGTVEIQSMWKIWSREAGKSER